MGRTIRTVPIPEGRYGPAYYHRTHRSRKNQKQRVIEEMKAAKYDMAKQRDNDKEERRLAKQIKKLLYK